MRRDDALEHRPRNGDATHVGLGAHTRRHRRLKALSDAECDDELGGSKERIEREVKAPCAHFAARTTVERQTSTPVQQSPATDSAKKAFDDLFNF